MTLFEGAYGVIDAENRYRYDNIVPFDFINPSWKTTNPNQYYSTLWNNMNKFHEQITLPIIDQQIRELNQTIPIFAC